jgi:GMP synthase-like glutamine amidotransferase
VRALVLQHDDEAPLGTIATVFDRRRVAVDLYRADQIHASSIAEATTSSRPDLIVVLGALESVLRAGAQPWYVAEQSLLRDANDSAVPILGVCFGAQILADTFGGAVNHLAMPEVGWTTVRTSEPNVVAPGPWLNFHTDAVVPPPGALIVATSDDCVQAYRFGRHLAVQFHPEVTTATVKIWLDWLRPSLDAAGADGGALLAIAQRDEAAIAARCDALVSAFLRSI